MTSQRARGAENRVRNKSTAVMNHPAGLMLMQEAEWTAEGAVKGMSSHSEYSATCGHTSVAGDIALEKQQPYPDKRTGSSP